jgi:hypothetical protein
MYNNQFREVPSEEKTKASLIYFMILLRTRKILFKLEIKKLIQISIH